MATSGIAKSYVRSSSPGKGAYYSWEWTSEKISPGVTRINWKLYGKGIVDGSGESNFYANECYIYATYNDSTKTIYSLPWKYDQDYTTTGKNTAFNTRFSTSFRTSGSFDVIHDSSGAASFTIKITASIYSGAGTGGTTTTTFNLDTNQGTNTVYIKINGAWKTANQVYFKSNGAWHSGEALIKQNGTWT